MIREIGGSSQEVGEVRIQIPVTDLKLVIEVTFVIKINPVPTLWSMRDILDNGLVLSIHDQELHFNKSINHAET